MCWRPRRVIREQDGHECIRLIELIGPVQFDRQNNQHVPAAVREALDRLPGKLEIAEQRLRKRDLGPFVLIGSPRERGAIVAIKTALQVSAAVRQQVRDIVAANRRMLMAICSGVSLLSGRRFMSSVRRILVIEPSKRSETVNGASRVSNRAATISCSSKTAASRAARAARILKAPRRAF
jgi:hypothetical protein